MKDDLARWEDESPAVHELEASSVDDQASAEFWGQSCPHCDSDECDFSEANPVCTVMS